MDQEQIIEKNGGNANAYRLVKALDNSSYTLKQSVMISVFVDVELSAVDNYSLKTPYEMLKDGIRKYILKHPGEYVDAFECCFSKEELKSIKGGE